MHTVHNNVILLICSCAETNKSTAHTQHSTCKFAQNKAIAYYHGMAPVIHSSNTLAKHPFNSNSMGSSEILDNYVP